MPTINISALKDLIRKADEGCTDAHQELEQLSDVLAEVCVHQFEEIGRLKSRCASLESEVRWSTKHLPDGVKIKRRWACEGCGSTQALHQIREKDNNLISCCPERRLLPKILTGEFEAAKTLEPTHD